MICRLWRGRTTRDDADAYEGVVRSQVIPAIEAMDISGFRSIDLLRRAVPAESRVEFTTLMWFDSLDDVRNFTGVDYEVAHVPAAAQAVLASFEPRAAHFEVLERRQQSYGKLRGERTIDLPATSALVVIDVQNAFLDPDWGPRNNPQAEVNIAVLIDAWRAAGRPIHHVHHASRSPLGKFREGTPGFTPKAEAAPLKGEPVHVKRVNSGFIGTNLEQALRDTGVDTVVIVGLTTNHCVSTTTRMAGNLGFETFIVYDATAAFARAALDGRLRAAQDVHDDALSDLSDEFATVVTTEQVLEAVERRRPASAPRSMPAADEAR